MGTMADEPELHEALLRGAPVDTIKRLLEEHPDQVDMTWEEGCRPMHYACSYGASLAVMRLLADADPRCMKRRDDSGQTPLHTILTRSEARVLEAVQFIIERDPETLGVADASLNLPLHIALDHNAPEQVVEVLLRGNLEAAEARSGSGWMPLHWGCARAHPPSAVRMLLEACPSAVRERAEGHLPIHLACKKSSTSLETVKLLVDAYSESVRELDRDLNGDTVYPVHWACNGLPDTADSVRYLLTAYPEAALLRIPKHFGGEYLLHTLVRVRGPLDIVRKVVDIFPRALQQRIGHDMCCPLHFACQHGAPRSVIEYLVEEAPEHLRMLTKNNHTPLHLLFLERRTPALLATDSEDSPPLVDLVRRMIALHPGSTRQRDKFERLPLHVACNSYAPLPIIECLVDSFQMGLLQRGEAAESPDVPRSLALRIAEEKVRCNPAEPQHGVLL